MVCSKLWREVFLMRVVQMAELVPHAMAGMRCGRAYNLLRLHCVVAQGPASHVLLVLLVMVASLVGMLFDDGILLPLCSWRLPSSLRSSCQPPSTTPLTTWSMLLYDLPSAGLTTIVGASIFVF